MKQLALSSALDSLAPVQCVLLDDQDNEVKLTSGGYLLQPGHSYRVCLRLPCLDEEVLDVYLEAPPDYIQESAQLIEKVEENVSVRIRAFSVKSLAHQLTTKRFHPILHQLKIIYKLKRKDRVISEDYRLPIVIQLSGNRIPWGIIITFILSVAGQIAGDFFMSDQLPNGLRDFLLRKGVLIAGMIIVGVMVLFTVGVWWINHRAIYQRGKELRKEFQDTYKWDYTQ